MAMMRSRVMNTLRANGYMQDLMNGDIERIIKQLKKMNRKQK